jgi:hypothetical protein
MLCTSSDTKFVLRLAQKALEKFREQFPSERAFISIKCYPWKSAKQIKSLDVEYLKEIREQKIMIKTTNINGGEIKESEDIINKKIEFIDKPNTIEYSVEVDHSETQSVDISKKKNKNKMRSIKKPSDIPETLQGPSYKIIEFHQEQIQDMFPIDSVIEVSDGSQELYYSKLIESEKKMELERIRKEIEDLQNVNQELQLKVELANKEANKLRENAENVKEEQIKFEEVFKLKAIIVEKDQSILEAEKKVKACEAIITKLKEVTDKLVKENRDCKENSRLMKEELTKKQNESLMKSKMLESVDIRLGTGMIDLLRVHRTFMDELRLADRPIMETLKKYMEIQLKMRNAKEKVEKIIKERWPLMFDEWDSYRKECGLLDSLLFLVQIAN